MSPELPELKLADHPALLAQLADSPSPIPVIRNILKQTQQHADDYFRATLDAETPVRFRSAQMDALLDCLWQHTGLQNDDLALVAVGGYGRGELHPYSDIDLLLLCRDEAAITTSSEQLQGFITLLWDLKLEVGHSVRTLEDCRNEAANDLTIITNMLESRIISGAPSLFADLKAIVDSPDMWPAATFFKEKWQELEARHDKHNDSEYNLEPNVKNSPGALRDIQTVSWVTTRHFGDGSLQSLESRGFLTKFEFTRLAGSMKFLWQVRYALHMLAGREEDRLLFNLQRQIASLLGFEDDNEHLGVERFMTRFYRNQLSTTELCDLLLLHFNEDFMKSHEGVKPVPVNEHFVLFNGYLQLTDPQLFAREPAWLLKVFVLCANTPDLKGVHSDTIRALRDHRHLIDYEFRTHPDNNACFIELICHKNHVVRELSRMMRYGILGRYIPEFGHIIGMMEHDLLHIHTVDDHSFRMIRMLRQLRFSSLRNQYPLASKLIHRIQRREVLYLAALLHDTGKAQEGDHSSNGEVIALQFCSQHNLRPTDTHMVCWLVANHLTMSHAAQRLDLNNPDDIHQFAREIGDQYHLDMLYLITVADMISTNPKLWTSWRAEQMRALYFNTQQALRRGLANPLNKEEYIREIQQESLLQLEALGLSRETTLSIWGEPGDDYFLRESVDNIIWHTLSIAGHGNSSAPLVSIHQTSDQDREGATQIFIYMKDHIDLFAVTTATLDQLNLNIQDARIMTSESDDKAVDTYIVLDENNRLIDDPQRLDDIRQALITALANPEEYSTIIQRRTPRLLKQFPVETQVTMSNDPHMQRTILEVVAADRPGLLARVGAILSEFGAQMQGAKILTEGERVSDIFYILDQSGEPFSDPALCQQLQRAIVKGLDDQVQVQTAV
ncbi:MULTISPECIES: [protein-PII] uridylyltransferase [unclassified Oceanobacter]|jgi:[protein-PII] uridylyltransferase|uniref:[protein-PII] uridylyltransferase n=1 Tax=unclassified Oceanobacter TaxID=2620260 RepID=UPI0026E3D2BA|nr:MULTISPECIES: [protein-PII] uridylyltransferase [unclassified Oceanobacter]MDO6682825.1 [protein-PII] uridylyltransferase [Oceanobacter sp. 5_MG-2023]MDP2504897.1 [protein-PII] uridylyltransferase [Oceanobacter sp. 3_MG-2023]MDP2546341.1 [protein-PII] uridylyltransferase [Oceanobacter sp. 4_MG-2023]MDP2607642.1 [protein-PII] uridylyltransferase [Oceanobacter sp. 1_MG-2023]MDP2610910.1 [protein-PII] uridylyltransferase [Oceanobacter sp. 2_MG-2023]